MSTEKKNPQEGHVLPCTVRVGAGHFHKGVSVSILQGAIDRQQKYFIKTAKKIIGPEVVTVQHFNAQMTLLTNADDPLFERLMFLFPNGLKIISGVPCADEKAESK